MHKFSVKWVKWNLVCYLCLLAFTGCSHDTAPSLPSKPASPAPMPTPVPTVDAIQNKLQQMTVEEKIGQMIFAGIDGFDMNRLTNELITTYKVGGLILYKTNVKTTGQLVELVNTLKRTNAGNKLPLWMGVDEEGGKVTRLPDEIAKTPPNKQVGKTNSKELAYSIGNLLGKELNAYGLNVDFAPVLDINSNPNNPVIGERSFGTNAPIVSSMGIQEMKGLQAQRVLPVVKHFPGHGDTSEDSHIGLPVVQHNLDRLRKLELVPFAEAFSQQADAVMVAHILLPKVDTQYPASMSKKIITGLLRQEMDFNGLIVSDDMTMGAILKNYELGEAAVQSVLAGTDVVMVAHEYDKIVTVIGALRKAVEEKRIPMQTIDQSVTRIIKLKQKYQVQDTAVSSPDVNQFNAAVSELLATYPNK
jgi:beta-N-acetylhexosaminidase